MSYDTWLEKPYDDIAKAAERFEPYWTRYGPKIMEIVKGAIIETMPENILDGVTNDLWSILDDLHEEVLADWAHHLAAEQIPNYESWLEQQNEKPN